MGIFINLAISKSVTKCEWANVYEEVLLLVNKLPLAEKKWVRIQGINTFCLVPTEERKETYGWNKEKTRLGWTAVGDYVSMRTAEEYWLPRDLIGNDEVEPDAGDAMFGVLPLYMSYDFEDERFQHIYELWGAKSQGEPYHIYLLAIACLIEARLGVKAFIYGDITRGQCKKAVEIANEYLKKPIEMPDRCYMDRLLERVLQLPLSQEEQINVFEEFFLGTKNKEFGDYMRKFYSDVIIDTYWKKRFGGTHIDTYGFDNLFNEYMLCGFELEKLCEYVEFYDKEGNPQYKEFIKRIMDAKLHLEDKNCTDILKINQEEERTYGIWTLMAQFVYASASNKKVARYIPIQDIRKALHTGIGDKCNVDELIDAYLAEEAEQVKINISRDMSDKDFEAAVEQDTAEVFNQIMEKRLAEQQEVFEKYDISEYGMLKFYKNGDTMHPGIMKSLGKARKFLDAVLEEEEFSKLMKKSAHKRCKWLIDRNQYILIRDKDWIKVFADIEENKESFARYYPLVRVRMDSQNISEMCVGLMLNDELYEYSKILTDQLENEI